VSFGPAIPICAEATTGASTSAVKSIQVMKGFKRVFIPFHLPLL
jgi:hypothetical protein